VHLSGSLDAIARLSGGKVSIPEDWAFAEARAFFQDPPVAGAGCSIAGGDPDYAALEQFLGPVHRRDFKPFPIANRFRTVMFNG
jgi:hypothetical protein